MSHRETAARVRPYDHWTHDHIPQKDTMRSLRALLVLPALVLLPAAVAAQRPSTGAVPDSLSLSDAMQLAVRYNPTFRQIENDLGPAAWSVRNSYASFLPSLTLSNGYTYQDAGSNSLLGSAFMAPSATLSSTYSLSLDLSLSGQTFMQPGLARAEQRAADASVAGAEINLQAAVRRQYLAVLQAQAQVDLAETQLRRNQEFERLAQARFEVGQNTLLDVRQAEVARGQSAVALLQARQAVVVEKLRLFEQIGLPGSEDPAAVVLTDSFAITQPAWELTALLGESEQQNPDLTALRARQASARANERAVRSEWLPSLNLGATWSGFTQEFTDADPLIAAAQMDAAAALTGCQQQNELHGAVNTGFGTSLPIADCSRFTFGAPEAAALRNQNAVFPFDFTTQPWRASVFISFPIFTQLARPLRNAQASAVAADAREAVRQRELLVRRAVTEQYYALLTAHETIGLQENNRGAAGEQLRLATERYRVGSGTFFELLDAQLAAERAEADYINAVYAYHQAIASLEEAVGRPLR